MTMAARLRAPGWYRAALGLPAGFGIGMGIDIAIRALYGWHPLVGCVVKVLVLNKYTAPNGPNSQDGVGDLLVIVRFKQDFRLSVSG